MQPTWVQMPYPPRDAQTSDLREIGSSGFGVEFHKVTSCREQHVNLEKQNHEQSQ